MQCMQARPVCGEPGLFSSMTASAGTQTVRFAVSRSKIATFANRERACSIAMRSASQDTLSPSKAAREKCHEMFKSCLQPGHWPYRTPTRLVQQAVLLLEAMPQQLRSRTAKPVTTRTERPDTSEGFGCSQMRTPVEASVNLTFCDRRPKLQLPQDASRSA